MSLAALLGLVNLFCAGILAGAEIVIHYGLRAPAASLDARAQLQLRQALVLRLRILVPVFFVPTALSSVAVTILDGAPGVWLRGAALLALFVWILIRVVGTVPINSATLTWDLAAPPQDWQQRVDRAERFHIVGTWAAVLAFALLLGATAIVIA